MSSAQFATWLDQQAAPDIAYTVAGYVHVPGPLDPDLLAASALAVGREYVSPCTRIVVGDDGAPQQIFDEHVDFAPRVISLPAVQEADGLAARIARAVEWMRTEASTPPGATARVPVIQRLIQVGADHWLWYVRAHRLVLDDHGIFAMVMQTAEHYSAAIERTDPPRLRPRPLDPAGMVAAEQKYLASTRAQTDAGYWSRRTPSLPTPVPLTGRHAAPSRMNLRHNGNLDHGLGGRLAAAATELRTTPDRLVTAAFGSYAARLAGRDDTLLALSVPARITAAARVSAGSTASTLPLAIRIGGMGVGAFAAQIDADIRGGLRHQLYPAAGIGAPTLRPGAPGSGCGDSISMMVPASMIRLGPVGGEFHPLTSGPVEDVAVSVRQADATGFRMDFEMNPACGSADDLRRHHERFHRYLGRFVTSSADTKVADVDLLDPHDVVGLTGRRREEASAGSDIPGPPLPELFRVNASRSPDVVAVQDADRSITYRELDWMSDRLAGHLAGIGARPERAVLLRMRPCLEYVVAVWAVAKTGAACVPVDPRVPGLSPEDIAEFVHPVAGLDADDVYRLTATDSESPVPSRVLHVDQLACLFLTAGWPGVPGAVGVSHRGLGAAVDDLIGTAGIEPGGRLMHFGSTGFHVSALDVIVAAVSRSTLVVPPTDATGSPGVQTALLVERITTAFLTTSNAATLEPDALADLRTLVVNGAPAPQLIVDRWGSGAPGTAGRTMVDFYGMAEMQGTALIGTPAAGTPVRLGRPVHGTRLHLLDTRLRPVPAGAIGEIYLSGVGLARGYHADPSGTAARFVANPNDSAGERMYRTGDLARWGNDGRLEFVGHGGGRAVVHGFRVDLESVDALLRSYPGVEQSATRIMDDGTAAVGQLVSYVAGTGDAVALRDRLAVSLPWYAVPDHIVILDALPTTANGAIDEDRLPIPDRLSGTYPESSAEQAVAQVFADAVGSSSPSEIDMRASLFDLGGNAATAHRVAGRLSIMTGRTVTADEVLVAPRIGALTALLESVDAALPSVVSVPAHPGQTASSRGPAAGATRDVVLPILPLPAPPVAPPEIPGGPPDLGPVPMGDETQADAVIPLLPAQQELWRRNRIEADSTHHIRLALDLNGDLDVPALWAALADVVYRHAPLRTVYPVGAQAPVQRTLPPASGQLEFTMVPLTGDGLDDADQVFTAEPFDLATQVPLRARLFELGGRRYRLLFVLHQIAVDGPSMVPLVRDLATAYSARLAHRKPEFTPLSRTFGDYALEHQRAVQSRRKSLGQFWLDTLLGAPAESSVPPLRPRSVHGATRVGTVRRAVDTVTWTQVAELCEARRVTPFQLVHAALTVLLARLGAGDDIVIGTSVAGRDEPDLEDLVGMFVNSVPLRTQVAEAKTFAEHLEYTAAVDADARAHSEFPFEDLVRLLDPPTVPGRGPIFQVVLTQRSQGMMHVSMPGVEVNVRPYDVPISRVDLEFILGIDGEIELRHARDMYPRDQAEAIIDALMVLLSWAVRAPDTRIGMLPVIGDDDRHRVYPASGPAGADETTLAELLRSASRAHPDRLAAVDGARLLRYSDLHHRASRLATLLVEIGVQPGELVITHVPRSLESLIVFWGIALAGGAIAALDPHDPVDRIGEILSDTTCRLGITDRTHEIDGAPLEWLVVDTPEISDYLDGRGTNDDPGVVPPVSAAAYVIHGTGADERRSAVVVSHRGLANLATDLRERMQLTADARILAFASPAQDTAIMELLMAASSGATLIVVPESVSGGTDLEQLIVSTQLTHAYLPAAALTSLRSDRLPDLAYVMTGGASLPADLAGQWRIGRHLFWLRGSPEGGMTTTVARITDDRFGIGAPVRGTSVVVLDTRLRPVPIGVPGELYVLGAPLAQGYRRDTPLTAARFVASPLRPGERMYRTGERVRWIVGPDGDLILDLIGDDAIDSGDDRIDGSAGEPAKTVADVESPADDDVAVSAPLHIPGDVGAPAPPDILPDIPREVSRSGRLPLSSAQERLWLLDKLDSGSTYHLVATFDADGLDERGGVDDDVLRVAVHDVLMRHETLRSSYLADRIGPYQHVLEPTRDEIPIDSVADVDTADVDDVIAEFVGREFRLDTGVPIRVRVIRTSDARTAVVLVIHRIAADPGSIAPLCRDLELAYRARGAGVEPGWPDLPLQYADHAVWQRRQGRHLRSIDHFVARLRDAPGESTFGEDRARPAVVHTAAGEVTAQVRPADRYAMSGFARTAGVSEFAVLHAALVATLHRLAGLDDIVIGTQVSGRDDAWMRDLVGPFENLVALRTTVDPAESFEELAHRVHAADTDDLAASAAPFERVAAAVVTDRNESVHPVFQVLLTEQGSGTPGGDAGGLRLRPQVTRTSPFDVVIEVAVVDDGLRLTLRHRLDLYRTSTATAILDRYAALLSAAISTPGTAVGDLPILLPGDINDLVGGGPHVSVNPMPLSGLLDRAVRRAPSAQAVEAGERSVTYGEIDSMATDLAVRLLEAGVREGDRVAVVLDRSIDSVIAFWAVIRAGGIHVAVDPSIGSARIDRFLRRTARGAGTGGTGAGGFAVGRAGSGSGPDDLTWIAVDADRSVRAASAHAEDLPRPRSTDPAYLVYPSGFSGPGVLVGQRGLAPLAESMSRAMDVGRDARVVHAAAPGGDAGVLEILVATWATATLVVAPGEVAGGHALVDFIASHHVTHLYRSAAGLAEMPARELPGLATIAVGGGAPHVRSIEDWAPGRRMLTMYTAAEVSIAATVAEVDPVQHTLGSPLARTQLLVCDDRLSALPPGVVGELYVAGPGVAQGYTSDPRTTAARFVANPYARTADQERMFRTGMLVRWRMGERGTAEFEHVGRADDRRIVRGFRVSIPDVVRAIESHPEVRAAIAVAPTRAVANEGPSHIAYVSSDNPIDPARMRAHLAQRLPRHMIPDEFVALPSIPRLPDGRPDRRALPRPDMTIGDPAADPAGIPWRVARVLAEVLGVPMLGLDDDFFGRGGTSLQAALAVDRLRNEFGANEIGMRAFLDDARVGAIAAQVAASAVPTGPVAGPVTDHLLPLRPADGGRCGRPTVFCVHSEFGVAWQYTGLGARLDPAIPLVGVQSQGITTAVPPAASIAELARGYVVSIRGAQAAGPYVLVGWGLGGLIAHAMGCELRRLGEEVRLVLLDSYPVGDAHAAGSRRGAGTPELSALVGGLAGHAVDGASTIDAAIERLHEIGGPAGELDADMVGRLYSEYLRDIELERRHIPSVFDGDMVFYRATRDARRGLHVGLWGAYVTGEVEVRDFDVSHDDLGRSPAIDEIGADLNDIVREPISTRTAVAHRAHIRLAGDSAASTVVEVHNVTRVFGRGTSSVRAVDGVSLSIGHGRTLALLGPNGAGKTTTARIIAGFDRPTSGVVLIDGIDAVHHPRRIRGRIGMSGQHVAVDEKLTGAENLAMLAHLHRMRGPAGRARAATLIDQFGLGEVADRQVGTYSGGMRRRLDLAAAQVGRPSLVILDEPTAGLDPQSRRDMWGVISGLGGEGAAVLLTTQYLDEADELADEVAIVDHGRVIRRGTPGALKAAVGGDVVRITLEDPVARYSARAILARQLVGAEVDSVDDGVTEFRTLEFRAADGPRALADALSALTREGVEVAAARVREATLDDVFFTLTGGYRDRGGAGPAPEVRR